jgi:KDO2-lipid IV(A) lauroyltransferase
MHAQAGRAFRHRFEGPLYRRMMVAAVRSAPPALLRSSMPLWAGLFFGLLPRARRSVEGNLAQALGEVGPAAVRRAAYRLFVNYAQSVANVYRVHAGAPLPVKVRYVGRERVYRIVESGRGLVTVTGHLGPWQLTPYAVSAEGALPPMTIAMAEEPSAAVAELETRYRARLRIVYTTRSAFSLLDLAAVLRRCEIVGIQLDRHLGGPHLTLPFLGRPAAFPLGPAMLARTTGCPIVPVFAVDPDGRRRAMEVRYEEPIEVARTAHRAADLAQAMSRVVGVYERYVRAYPTQWFNFHDFWQAPKAARPG